MSRFQEHGVTCPSQDYLNTVLLRNVAWDKDYGWSLRHLTWFWGLHGGIRNRISQYCSCE